MPIIFMFYIPLVLLGGTGLLCLIGAIMNNELLYAAFYFPSLLVISGVSFLIGLFLWIISKPSSKCEPDDGNDDFYWGNTSSSDSTTSDNSSTKDNSSKSLKCDNHSHRDQPDNNISNDSDNDSCSSSDSSSDSGSSDD